MADRVARKRLPHASAEPLDTVERMLRLRQEAERIIAELFKSAPGSAGGAAPQGPRLPLDLYEGTGAFLLSLEVPGVAREDLSLSVVGGSLVVEGRKREEPAPGFGAGERIAYECAERAYGSFRRVIVLPGAADTGRIRARLSRGVLEVELPRIRERRGRRREVPVG